MSKRDRSRGVGLQVLSCGKSSGIILLRMLKLIARLILLSLPTLPVNLHPKQLRFSKHLLENISQSSSTFCLNLYSTIQMQVIIMFVLPLLVRFLGRTILQTFVLVCCFVFTANSLTHSTYGQDWNQPQSENHRWKKVSCLILFSFLLLLQSLHTITCTKEFFLAWYDHLFVFLSCTCSPGSFWLRLFQFLFCSF